MSATVVTLRSDIQIVPGEPNADAIEMLRSYLEQAERGEISAVAFAAIRPNNVPVVAWSDVPADGIDRLHSAAVLLAHELTAGLAASLQNVKR